MKTKSKFKITKGATSVDIGPDPTSIFAITPQLFIKSIGEASVGVITVSFAISQKDALQIAGRILAACYGPEKNRPKGKTK